MVEEIKRVKLISDIIQGMKVVKFYSWEDSFTVRIAATRAAEMKLLLEDIEANGKMGDGTPLPARTTQLTEELQREAQNAADRRAVKAR